MHAHANFFFQIYEGVEPRCAIKLADYAGNVQLRARCIRPDLQGHLSSPSTPILHIQNERSVKEEDSKVS